MHPWNLYATALESGLKPPSIRRVALNLYDGAHCLGATWHFAEWRRQFKPGRSDDAALRAWERLKAELRAVGVVFELKPLQGAENLSWSLVFRSVSYMFAVTEALCPVDRQAPSSTETRFPGWRGKAVRA